MALRPPLTAAEPWPARPTGGRRWWPAVSAATAVVGVVAVTLWQLHLPLLLSATTTTGGDTGAHFMMPALFNSILFPHLTGWDPGWYAGYPAYTFYFVLPDALTAVAAHVIGYDVAFKLSTVLGSVLLPVAAWACGRLFGMRPPLPGVLAAATLPFLFDYTWTIYGGNLFSTLAGEYPYSLSIALALVFLGLVARGLRTGQYRTWASVVLALSILAHFVPALFGIAGAVVLTLLELLPPRLRVHDDVRLPGAATSGAPRPRLHVLWWGASTVAIGVFLSGWWLAPFGLDLPYSTSMGYTNVTTYATLLFPEADRWALVMAGVAVVVALALRSRFGATLAVLAGVSAVGLVVDPQGKLYNVRLLPLWFLCVYLLAGWLLGVSVVAGVKVWRRGRLSAWASLARWSADHPGGRRLPPRPRPARWMPGAIAGPLVALAAAMAVVVPPFVPGSTSFLSGLGVHPGANQVSVWADWNYTGYEGKADYPEYRALMRLMTRIGHEDGCGRAMWEYNADENRFGTPEALMLLPYWTGGCVDSMEGLLFESSATTPYHFLNQAELSASPSEPVVGLPYGPLDVPLGVQHLQLLGVRYFMAASPQVESAANADPTLHLLARSGPWTTDYGGSTLTTTWDVYLVRHSSTVVPLRNEPAVLRGVGAGQATWLGKVGPQGQPIDGPSVAWYQHPTRWDVELTAGGPSSWPRVSAAGALHAPARPVVPTTVTDVRQTSSSISFHVSRVGAPVLVKVSYFPNWHASGAEGPWRATPNQMVVVPTSHRVTLTYGTTGADLLGDAVTGLGVAALVALGGIEWWRRRRVGSAPHAGHR